MHPPHFQIHYPARGRKLISKPVPNTIISAFKSITPRGDGNYTLLHTHQSSVGLFQIHYPARGRKPAGGLRSLFNERRLSNPLPREGTETRRMFHRTLRICSFKSITPRGDGNQKDVFCGRVVSNTFKSITPRGDGNLQKLTILSSESRRSFKSITPRAIVFAVKGWFE